MFWDDGIQAEITARYICEAWLPTRGQIESICTNRVMERPSPPPESVHAVVEVLRDEQETLFPTVLLQRRPEGS